MRADRLLSILLLLQTEQRLTARELAERLEVSERTIYRDMEALSGAGVPVVAERGRGGGWQLLEGYRTNLTGLTPDETGALLLSVPAPLLDDLGMKRAAEAARIKVLAALPPDQQRTARQMRELIHIDATAWHPSEENLAAFPLLQEALLQQRRVRLTYRRGDGNQVERLVDPLGLVAKGTTWYLVAATEGEVRSYRIARVREAVITEERAHWPARFDLARYWEQSLADFRASLPHYRAVLRVSPAVFPRLRYGGRFARAERAEPPDEEGWRRVSMRFQFEEEACEFVLGFGMGVEVVAPTGLRGRVLALAEQVVAHYRAGHSSSGG